MEQAYDWLWLPRMTGSFFLKIPTSCFENCVHENWAMAAKCTVISLIMFTAGVLKIAEDISEQKLAIFIMEMIGTIAVLSTLPLVHFRQQWNNRVHIFEAASIIEEVQKELGETKPTCKINLTRSYLTLSAILMTMACEVFVLNKHSTLDYFTYFVTYYVALIFEWSVVTEFVIFTKTIQLLRSRLINLLHGVNSNHDRLALLCIKLENRLLKANMMIYKAYEFVLFNCMTHYFFSVFFLVYLLTDEWTDDSYVSPIYGKLLTFVYLLLVQAPPFLATEPCEKHLSQINDLDNVLNRIWPHCSYSTQDLITVHYLRKRHGLAKQATCYKLFPISYSTLMSIISTSIMYVVIIFQLGV